MKEKEDEMNFWAVAFMVMLGLFTLYGIGSVSINTYDYFSKDIDKDNWITISATSTSSFSEKEELYLTEELLEKHPTYKEDWVWVHELISTNNNHEIPPIYLKQKSSWYNGEFDTFNQSVILNVSIYEMETTAYPRYVLIHEFVHAILHFERITNDDDHCYMKEQGYFFAIGNYIGNIELGKMSHDKYYSTCEK